MKIWMKNMSGISLKFVPKGKIHNELALVYVMAWHRTSHYTNQSCPILRIIDMIPGLDKLADINLDRGMDT